MNLSDLQPSQLDELISGITAEVATYTIAPSQLERFDAAKAEDREFLSYVQGTVGGYYCKFLALLIRRLQLKKITELGNREGLSTLCIHEVLPPDGLFTTIDLVKDLRYCPKSMFSDTRVRLLFGDDRDLRIFGDRFPWDTELLFIDTLHTYRQVYDEFYIYQHFLADTAIVAVDDININDERKFFDELSYPKWDLTSICHLSGWGLFLFRRKSAASPEERLLAAFRAAAEVWQRAAEESSMELQKKEQRHFKNKVRTFLHSHPSLHRATLRLRGKQ